jgi:hypothetical protein
VIPLSALYNLVGSPFNTVTDIPLNYKLVKVNIILNISLTTEKIIIPEGER